jgi:hypothetical protein
MPCAVGFDTRDDVRRNSVNPGTALSASSTVSAPLVSNSADDMTVIVTVGSARGTSVRDEVTLTASKNGAGCSVMRSACRSAATVSTACAKPAAVTRIGPCQPHPW